MLVVGIKTAIHTIMNKLYDIILLLSSVIDRRDNNMVYSLSLNDIETDFERKVILVKTLREILIS